MNKISLIILDNKVMYPSRLVRNHTPMHTQIYLGQFKAMKGLACAHSIAMSQGVCFCDRKQRSQTSGR